MGRRRGGGGENQHSKLAKQITYNAMMLSDLMVCLNSVLLYRSNKINKNNLLEILY